MTVLHCMVCARFLCATVSGPDAFLLSASHSLAGGSYFGSNIGGAEGAAYIAEALKVNTTLKKLKCVAHE